MDTFCSRSYLGRRWTLGTGIATPEIDSECRASKVVLNLASKVVMRGKVVELPGAIWNNLQKTPLCARPWNGLSL